MQSLVMIVKERYFTELKPEVMKKMMRGNTLRLREKRK